MDRLTSLTSSPASVSDIGSSPSLPGVDRPSAAGSSFGGLLHEAIEKVNHIQLQATQAVDALVTGQTQNIHQTMIALQQADISFQLMMQVRNKLVTAYEEIQRMQL
jgi:flagellar hook-basal body complex protein FliE